MKDYDNKLLDLLSILVNGYRNLALREDFEEAKQILNELREMNEFEVDTLTPISELGLSVRTDNLLKRGGIETIEQLKHKSYYDLTQFRNMGKKSLKEIYDVLINLEK